MKKLSIEIPGREHSWSFVFEGDARYLDDWRSDGLQVDEVLNLIPAWLPCWLIRPWCWAQSFVCGDWWG